MQESEPVQAEEAQVERAVDTATAERLKGEGNTLFSQRDFVEAVRVYEQALALVGPNDQGK
jgi:hypothetical protein